MTEITNELIYEVLKRMQDRLTALDRKVDEVKAELVSIRGHVVASQQDVHNVYMQLAGQDARLERIDRRLDLIEPAPLG
jgi:tetrahydromethanopterin S-methyltransferase subunit G